MVLSWFSCSSAFLARGEETGPTNGADVRSYGAKGDGVADDAPAIQAALDKEARAFLPRGTYRLGAQLVIRHKSGGLIGAGAGQTVLKPDATLTRGTVLVLSPSNETLTDIEIASFTLDGSSDPAKVQGIGVFNCKRVNVHGISPVKISGMIHLESVENFAICDIAGSELIEFISLNTVKKGVISNIRVDGADEGIDFYNGEDVEVAGVVISARDPLVIKPHAYSAGVDLSASRQITVSNCTFTGHYSGIHVKHDAVIGVELVPVEDVLISDCQIREYKTAGILLNVSKGRNCRIANCNIRSTQKDTTGIYNFLPEGNPTSFHPLHDRIWVAAKPPLLRIAPRRWLAGLGEEQAIAVVLCLRLISIPQVNQHI